MTLYRVRRLVPPAALERPRRWPSPVAISLRAGYDGAVVASTVWDGPPKGGQHARPIPCTCTKLGARTRSLVYVNRTRRAQRLLRGRLIFPSSTRPAGGRLGGRHPARWRRAPYKEHGPRHGLHQDLVPVRPQLGQRPSVDVGEVVVCCKGLPACIGPHAAGVGQAGWPPVAPLWPTVFHVRLLTNFAAPPRGWPMTPTAPARPRRSLL